MDASGLGSAELHCAGGEVDTSGLCWAGLGCLVAASGGEVDTSGPGWAELCRAAATSEGEADARTLPKQDRIP